MNSRANHIGWVALVAVWTAGCSAEPEPAESSGTTTEPAESAEPSDDGPTTPPDTPWTDAELTGTFAYGGFSVHMGDDEPGGGWFEEYSAAGDLLHAGNSFARAHRLSVSGAAQDVVAVQIHGLPVEGGGWSVLELDVALPAWVAGEVPLDGESAVGQLTRADGSVAYLSGGLLRLSHAGAASGEEVRGTFELLPVAEVAR